MSSALSTASGRGDATTSADTASMGEAAVMKGCRELGDSSEDTTLKPRALDELLALSGLCNFLYLEAHAFAFLEYAAVMPRPDIEYELRLLAPPLNAIGQPPRIVALIRDNKRIKLLHGPRQRECCHGWICDPEEDEVTVILKELDQLRLASPTENPQDAQRKQAKVMATVLFLERMKVVDAGRDESMLHQSHALSNDIGPFISARYDTRELLRERGLEGLLEWKVVLN